MYRVSRLKGADGCFKREVWDGSGGVRNFHASSVRERKKRFALTRFPKLERRVFPHEHKELLKTLRTSYAPPVGWSFQNEMEVQRYKPTNEEFRNEYGFLMLKSPAKFSDIKDTDQRLDPVLAEQGLEHTFDLPTQEEIDRIGGDLDPTKRIHKNNENLEVSFHQEEVGSRSPRETLGSRERSEDSEDTHRFESEDVSGQRTQRMAKGSKEEVNPEDLEAAALDELLLRTVDDGRVSTDLKEVVNHSVWRRRLELAETSVMIRIFFQRRHRNADAYLELLLMLRSYFRGKDALAVLQSMLSDRIIIRPEHLCHAAAAAAQAGCTDDIERMFYLFRGNPEKPVSPLVDPSRISVHDWMVQCLADSKAKNADVDGIINIMLTLKNRESLFRPKKLHPSSSSSQQALAASAYESETDGILGENSETSEGSALEEIEGYEMGLQEASILDTSLESYLASQQPEDSADALLHGPEGHSALDEETEFRHPPMPRGTAYKALETQRRVERDLHWEDAGKIDNPFGEDQVVFELKPGVEQDIHTIPWHNLHRSDRLWSALITAFGNNSDHLGARLAYGWHQRFNPEQALSMDAYEALLSADNNANNSTLNNEFGWGVWQEILRFQLEPSVGVVVQILKSCDNNHAMQVYDHLATIGFQIGPRIYRSQLKSIVRSPAKTPDDIVNESESKFSEIVDQCGGFGFVGVDIFGEFMNNLAKACRRRVLEKRLNELEFGKDDEEGEDKFGTLADEDGEDEELNKPLTDLEKGDVVMKLFSQTNIPMGEGRVLLSNYIALHLWSGEFDKAMKLQRKYFSPNGGFEPPRGMMNSWALYLDNDPDTISLDYIKEAYNVLQRSGLEWEERSLLSFSRAFCLQKDYKAAADAAYQLQYVQSRSTSNRVREFLLQLSKLADDPDEFVKRMNAFGYNLDMSRHWQKGFSRTQREPLTLQGINWWKGSSVGSQRKFDVRVL
ncbi:hypothetical protein NDN08_000262 [Rhodosorus marinus]|uniref:Uncharacterized protein n=1 Tax=Rhodosorus marinus TaxID=101924 RepID=A0AAV8UEQ8_9RHOD|nr:hypothetical protein NDN08_000262 [Rhodosorus marinus]